MSTHAEHAAADERSRWREDIERVDAVIAALLDERARLIALGRRLERIIEEPGAADSRTIAGSYVE
jgi:hypothetical protein